MAPCSRQNLGPRQIDAEDRSEPARVRSQRSRSAARAGAAGVGQGRLCPVPHVAVALQPRHRRARRDVWGTACCGKVRERRRVLVASALRIGARARRKLTDHRRASRHGRGRARNPKALPRGGAHREAHQLEVGRSSIPSSSTPPGIWRCLRRAPGGAASRSPRSKGAWTGRRRAAWPPCGRSAV